MEVVKAPLCMDVIISCLKTDLGRMKGAQEDLYCNEY